MTTYQDYAIEKKLVKLEEEVKQLKTNQNYGTDQIQMVFVGDLSVPSRDATYYTSYVVREVNIRIYVTGIYPDRPLQVYMAADHLPHLFLFDVYVDFTAMNYAAGDALNKATIRFMHSMLPAEYQDPFTAQLHIYANQPASFTWEYV